MPKIKTHSGSAKRFRVTGNGKIKTKRSGLKHGMRKKGQKCKRSLRQSGIMSAADEKRIKVLLPYA